MPGRSAAPLGVDVASYQGYPDWEQVATSGMSFAFTKATGGAWYVNPSFEYNWRSIKAAGLQRGAYAYAFESSGQPLPGPGPEAEADFFCDTVEPQGIDAGDMLVLDIEEGPPGPLGEWVLRWCRRVEERVGFKPLIYTGRWFSDPHSFPACPDLAEYGLWLAAYQATMPIPPAPWPILAFWQYTASATVPGIAGACDANLFNGSLDRLPLYGKPNGTPPAGAVEPEPPVEPTPPPAGDLPVYDKDEPARMQEHDWDCAQESCEWMLYAYGRTPDGPWMEQSMIDGGYVTPSLGCTDASGAGLAEWLNAEYGEFGYSASNDPEVTFDDVAAEAQTAQHPLAIGGRGWYHWSGVRDYDAASDCLILANPAPGWQGVGDTMTRAQWDSLGPWSMVRLTHPAAEAEGGPDTDPPTDYGSAIGSGLLELMAQDGTRPAQSVSMWYPPGSPADVEACFGENGTWYVWLLKPNAGYRYRPTTA